VRSTDKTDMVPATTTTVDILEQTLPKGGGVPVTFEKLTYTVKAKPEPLTIIDGVSGHFESGKMTALMGPSGSGKTTLMDLVAGRKNAGTIEGDVKFAGEKPTAAVLKHSCGYVEQFDTLIGELTVTQMLMYTAELKLPVTWTSEQRLQRVEEVITSLGLESCRNTVIGNALMRGISGGQGKRVNIGLALIHRPSILFLDEPTSGLDSRMANEIVQTLTRLAADARTIVSTIHSPTAFSFSLFDSLLMLQKGAVVYAGPVTEAQPYFTECGLGSIPKGGLFSLPEWLVDISSGADAASLQDKYQASALCERCAKQRTALAATLPGQLEGGAVREMIRQQAGPLRRLGVLLKYRMATHYKSGEFLGPRIGDKIIFGLLILSLYWDIGSGTDAQSIQSTASLLYFIMALCGYGAAAFVPSLTLDRPLFYRELADGNYSATIYYLSKFIEEALLASLTSFLFGLIVFWSCSLQGSFFTFVFTYYLTTMTGILLAYAIAALSPNMDAANALLPSYVTTCMYFGGLFLLFDKIPDGWAWFSWTSFLRYSWGAVMNNNFGQGTVAGSSRVFITGNGTAMTVNEFYGMEGSIMGSAWACLGLLAVLTLFFACCGGTVVNFVQHKSR